MTRDEMLKRGWEELDILLISGDAYVDHPSFGIALLGRFLEAKGYRVGIVAQPDWRTPEPLLAMGRPRLFCGVTAGALDSMLAHYTAFRKKRHDDAYTPGGRCGARPNRAVTVYTNLARQAFPGLPILVGGIEASLRRAAHYDFWCDSLRRSILQESRADLLVYGMGERALLEAAERLSQEEGLRGIPGTAVFLGAKAKLPHHYTELPSFEAIQESPPLLMTATLAIESQIQQGADRLLQRHGTQSLILEPPAPPLTTEEMDDLYRLPYTRAAHPSYQDPIPALAMIAESITALRGCGGGCSFCSLALHQGRRIQSRSKESICQEAKAIAEEAGKPIHISDVGGPTANAWKSRCTANPSTCARKSCYSPLPCPRLKLDQPGYLDLLSSVANEEGIRGVRVGSGLRFDLLEGESTALDKLAQHFVGGQLKVAPEHRVDSVLKGMRKTSFSTFEHFLQLFDAACARCGKEQYVIPYVMSAFPGCTLEDMRALSSWFREKGWHPQQVQCFIPTPGTVATAMFFGECDEGGEPLYVARSDRDRSDQHQLLTQGQKSTTSRPRRPDESHGKGKRRKGRRRGRGA
jgi:uncharacterized radical SAM protein YgiQ